MEDKQSRYYYLLDEIMSEIKMIQRPLRNELNDDDEEYEDPLIHHSLLTNIPDSTIEKLEKVCNNVLVTQYRLIDDEVTPTYFNPDQKLFDKITELSEIYSELNDLISGMVNAFEGVKSFHVRYPKMHMILDSSKVNSSISSKLVFTFDVTNITLLNDAIDHLGSLIQSDYLISID